LGLDETAAEPRDSVLGVEPLGITSPPGWKGEIHPYEEAELWEIGWSGPDNGITPGHQQCGFTVTVPRPSNAYLEAPYTLYLSASWIGGVLEPDDSTAPCESVGPTVRLTAPAEGASVSGIVDLEAEASDDVGVVGVYFTVDGEVVGDQLTAPPYSFAWDTSSVTPGPHVVGVLAADADGNGARATSNVSVRTDTTPPHLSVSAQPASLWPPNGNLVPVAIALSVSDDQDPNPAVSLVSITCDDACNPGEDIVDASTGTDDRHFQLRARRRGAAQGRTYTIKYRARDAGGNLASATTTVVVPHDQRR
jgi:hypothetical protein